MSVHGIRGVLLTTALLVTGCDAGRGPSAAGVEKTVRASLAAENAKDVDAFLALWTDKGLEAYDVGSRADLTAGKVEDSSRY